MKRLLASVGPICMARHMPTRTRVFPSERNAPSASACGRRASSCTNDPHDVYTYVPDELPRSSSVTPSAATVMRQCWRDTSGRSTGTQCTPGASCGWRPTRLTPVASGRR
eukprot:TRINITY_DN4322_c0_g1_i1.p2 TRINITY_DN4322_c0_g1~~TRINITY_DN4322_c0_g1_i1.p2  ORF type:complete len:110 (+),score=2.17 TRINITY_DN4322_c0_g1_i1:1-330(+)